MCKKQIPLKMAQLLHILVTDDVRPHLAQLCDDAGTALQRLADLPWQHYNTQCVEYMAQHKDVYYLIIVAWSLLTFGVAIYAWRQFMPVKK
jgi:hypothetical protein